MAKSPIQNELDPKEGFWVYQKRVISIVSIIIFLIVMIALFWFVGRPMIKFISEPSKYREWVDSNGFVGKLAFVGMMALQIIVAIIPGEPLEIAAGYTFGIWEGTFLCLVGAVIGSAIVFLFVRYLGMKAVEAFFPKEKIESLKFLHNTKKLNLTVFILFFIPGTPKDIMTYFIGLTNMKLSTWLLITSTARIPSIITSTIGGDALGLENYNFAIWVFAITTIVSIAGLIIYRKISVDNPKKKDEES